MNHSVVRRALSFARHSRPGLCVFPCPRCPPGHCLGIVRRSRCRLLEDARRPYSAFSIMGSCRLCRPRRSTELHAMDGFLSFLIIVASIVRGIRRSNVDYNDCSPGTRGGYERRRRHPCSFDAALAPPLTSGICTSAGRSALLKLAASADVWSKLLRCSAPESDD